MKYSFILLMEGQLVALLLHSFQLSFQASASRVPPPRTSTATPGTKTPQRVTRSPWRRPPPLERAPRQTPPTTPGTSSWACVPLRRARNLGTRRPRSRGPRRGPPRSAVNGARRRPPRRGCRVLARARTRSRTSSSRLRTSLTRPRSHRLPRLSGIRTAGRTGGRINKDR